MPRRSNADILISTNEIEFIFFKWDGATSTPSDRPLKLVAKLTYLSSKISSTERDVDINQEKAWTAIDNLSLIWKSDLSDKKVFFYKRWLSLGHCRMDHLKANETNEEKAWLEQPKNTKLKR